MSNNPNEESVQGVGQDQYFQQKRQSANESELTQQQRMRQELRQLPQGEQLFNWIAGHLQKRLEGVPQVLWQYADQNAAQQNRSQVISFLNGQTNEVLVTTQVNRQEIARTRSMQNSWIHHLLAQIRDSQGQQHQSQMHEKFEDRMADQYEEMMEKIQNK